ncbi:MAG: hypothetical protein CVV02_00185 [Firmicutes bacterium HGW-Firmicutes-7]|nr:MAG: hypothetical protein CVV02_00185 [Firmicutes bacterium HGW-Firmicutes-7]
MKVFPFKPLTLLLNYLMLFLMFFAAGVLISLPLLVKGYINMDITYAMPNASKLYFYILAILYVSGVCAIIILNELRKLFKTCALDNPFIIQNVTSLMKICYMSLVIAIVYLTKIIVLNSFFTMIVVFVFLMATVFCYVLAQLFESAVLFKTENDLTI